MPNMKEQFLKAANKNPKSPIAGVVRGVDRRQYEERKAERHARELEKLGGRFEYIGRAWLNHRMGSHVSISMRTLKEEWKELPPLLANIEESERVELIGRLAKGLMLSEDNTNSVGVRGPISGLFFKYSGDVQEMPNGVKLSLKSRYFMGAISDLSGHYDKERTSFIDFVSSRKDLRELVRLPQTFPAVAEWLVQQSNTAKKA